MVIFPNCKINLGLHIISKREDGFHNIETVFYPIQYIDALEIIQNSNALSPVLFTATGLTINEKEENNLCSKAYYLLKKKFPDLPSIKMHLHKVIPMGAGLGGGSADAAFTLKLLNEKFNISIPDNELIEYAAELGSDCPFFIINKPCFATGRGEKLEELQIDLSAYKIVLINPNIHVNTAWAFSQIAPALPIKSVKEIIQQPITTWANELINDFENPLFEKYPEIKIIKETLYKQGAVYASMSGSGSTVFGILKKEQPVPKFKDSKYFVHTII